MQCNWYKSTLWWPHGFCVTAGSTSSVSVSLIHCRILHTLRKPHYRKNATVLLQGKSSSSFWNPPPPFPSRWPDEEVSSSGWYNSADLGCYNLPLNNSHQFSHILTFCINFFFFFLDWISFVFFSSIFLAIAPYTFANCLIGSKVQYDFYIHFYSVYFFSTINVLHENTCWEHF